MSDKSKPKPKLCTLHTPGPWTVRQPDRNLAAQIVGADNRRVVGDVLFDVPNPQDAETNANAYLIAAAPVMAAALLEMLKAVDQLMPGLVHIAVQDYANINEAPIHARAALVKAGVL